MKKKRKKNSIVEAKIGFYRHLTSYVIVNLAMLLLTFGIQGRTNWFPVIIFWGMGLLFHYVSVFGFPATNGVMSKEWREKMRTSENEELEEEEWETDELELKSLNKEKQPQKKWNDKDLV